MNIARGEHANRFSEFMLVLISGSCKIKINDGIKEEIVTLDNPRTGLYLNKMIWKEIYDFPHNAILLILTSTNYDPNEYINNFDEFLCEVRGK